MILVTGGTGFVGRHLVNQLVAQRTPVRVLSRSPERHRFSPDVQVVPGDLTEPSSLPNPLKGIETVIHLAAVVGEGSDGNPRLAPVNEGGTEALARAARTAGVTRIIQVSSAGVYGDGARPEPHRETDPPAPATPYERSKLAAERRLVETLTGSSVQWTILRPTGVYGADRRATAEFFRSVARRRWWLHGPARVLVHPTHIDDLVRAIGLVLQRADLQGEVLNIGGERPVEFRELIRLIAKHLGRGPRQVTAPASAGTVAREAARLWADPDLMPPALARWGRIWINRAVNTSKARRQLGFEPVSLDWGLATTVTELRTQGLL